MNINFINLSTSMKNAEMKMKFQLRKKGIEPEEKSEKQRQVEDIQRQMADIREGDKIASMDAKLKAGGELTKEEMEYLKINNPELYKQAVEVKEEREQYKKQLQSCRTKEDVERLRAAKTNQFMVAIKAIKQNPTLPTSEKKKQLDQIQRRSMGIMNEHLKFVETPEYKELPTEEEVKGGKKQGVQGSFGPVKALIKEVAMQIDTDKGAKKIDIKM